MRNMHKTGLIIGITGTILIFFGLMMMQHYDIGRWIMYSGFIVVGVVWVWSIWDVIVAEDLRFYQKIFWLIVTISVPVMGGLLYSIMNQKPNRIVT